MGILRDKLKKARKEEEAESFKEPKICPLCKKVMVEWPHFLCVGCKIGNLTFSTRHSGTRLRKSQKMLQEPYE